MSPKIEPSTDRGPRASKIADALKVVGERWSLLIIREIDLGVGRFNDIQQNTGAPRVTLATRLHKLENEGIITRHVYSEHPPRHKYILTEAGEALQPVLKSLSTWGELHT